MKNEYKNEYRIIKHSDGDEIFYCIEECMLDEDGVLATHTVEYSPKCNSIEELKDTFEEMKKSFDKPILGSFPATKRDCCNE